MIRQKTMKAGLYYLYIKQMTFQQNSNKFDSAFNLHYLCPRYNTS